MERHTFLAVPIPYELQHQIHSYAEQINTILPLKKWTSPGDYHITLNFLGATSEDQAQQLVQNINHIKSDVHPFELTIDSVGVFGNPNTPRVCWLGVEQSSALTQLQQKTTKSCERAGFKTDDRPFRPHITLGKRWGGNAEITEQLPEPTQLTGSSWTVEEILLYEIHPQRVQKYVPYHRFHLGKED
ncbi:RNA 2',3'-cyclic phosphodiesterase [Pseudalkalibacillus sp. SCS-8]|uniref:RNA 2',3'-cyclic phosphodiesterase n=1 Tax=Pseudalkalibacillus nanhaiensis TaxID=3115291 RepID=UPI0032DBD65C